MNKIKPEIKDDIAETLFIPLLSRAHESHRKDAILKDPMACELVEKIDYDFAKFGKITMSILPEPLSAYAISIVWSSDSSTVR